MILFHRTTAEAAEAILSGGFRDGTGRYMTDREWSGVWLADRPLDPNEGAWGDVLLRVEIELTPDELAAFEWVEEGKPHREFLVPAARLNGRVVVAIDRQ